MDKKLHQQIVQQLLTLATAGFGLVAALAWNDTIQFLFKEYLDPVLKGGSAGIISRVVYAVIVTLIAVFVTYNLSRITGKSEGENKKPD